MTGGLDHATAYYFRGYLQADRGLILQPYLNLVGRGVAADGAVVRPYVSFFNSTHFGNNNPMNEMTDVMLGAVITWRPLVLDARYGYYNTAPTMRSVVHELGLRASGDVLWPWPDAEAPSALALRPFVGLYAEVSDQRGTEDVYVETGLEPSVRFDTCCGKVGVALPLVLGLSGDDYYFDDRGGNEPLGFFSAAVAVTIGLPAPDGCGKWFLSGSFQYLHLFADNLVAINRGDRDAFIGKVGIGFAF